MQKVDLRKNNQFWQEQQKATIINTSDEFTKTLWRRLLGTLMGDTNRLAEMRQHLEPDDMPVDMPFEREVFRAIHRCNTRNLPPTYENVLTGVVVSGELDMQQAIIKDGLDKIVELRTDDNMALESLSMWLSDLTKASRNEQAWKTALEVINSGKGLAQERQEAAMNIVTNVTGDEAAFESGGGEEVFLGLLDWADRRYEDRISGKQQLGPKLPWYGFTGHHGILQYGADYGDQTLITAQSGFGKSVVVGQVAEYNAYDQQICDVLVILLETNLHKMKARSLARNCLIPYEMFKSSAFSSKDPRFHKDVNGGDYRKTGAEPAKGSLKWYEQWVTGSSCEINYAFAPGATAYEVTQLMSIYRRKAEQRDKPLLVIVDYLYKINWKMFSHDERVGLSLVSDIIRDAVEIQNNKSPLHMIMMHQENDFGEPYGGQGIKQKSQMHLSLKRTKRQDPEPLPGGDIAIGKHLDAIGNQRYYQKAYDGQTSEARFVVNKANDAQGSGIMVRFENAKYKIHHHDKEAEKQN